jgi:ribosomal-protein-alanine acetyltransferase
MAWALREATEADVDEIMKLETATFGHDAWSAAVMMADVRSSNTVYLIASDDAAPGELAGYAGLLAPLRSGDSDIQTIAVQPAARRRGLGRMLMLALIAAARDRGARQVFLEVRADNPNAQALYESLGFQQIAVRPRYYQPDGVDANIMKLDLA